MHPSIPLLIMSLIYTFLILILFSSKDKIKTIENRIYKYLLLTVIVGILLDIAGIYCHLYLSDTSFIRWLVVKLYLLYLLFFVYLITIYVICVSYKNEMKADLNNLNNKKTSKIVKFITLLFIFSIILNFVLTYTYYNDGNNVYLIGSNTIFVYGMSGLAIMSWVYFVLKNRKNIPIIKVVPILMFVVICVPVILIQLSNPEILVVTSLTAFLTNFMYHTIENPDVKMLNEVYKNKELMEQTYEDKSNFLFEMTQEVREPLNEMRQICNEIKEDKKISDIKDKINLLNNSIRQLDFTVNDVLNISTLDVQRVKLIDNRYSLKGLYDDIISRVNVNNGVEFRTNIPNNLPYLYGDNIKLKQVIYSILMNSVSKTNEGFIEFNIDIIEKYDVARVIFTIRDSGIGMSIDKINDVLSTTSEFDSNDLSMLEKTEFNVKLCQKIVKAMGGNLLIKSKIGKGTEVILTIDQRKYIKDNNETIINSYEEKINNKKVLIISQDKNLVENIKDEFNKKDINYSHILYGKDALDKIKSGKKYDFIIVEDDMKEISGYETLKLLKEEKDFNTPVVILLNKDKENIKDHFMKDGFSDYILISDLRNEISRIIDKY